MLALRPVGAQTALSLQAAGLTVDGSARTYLFYVPSTYRPEHPSPLVLVFHGAGATGRGMARHTGFTALAEREGFVVAYPEGIGRRWNDGRGYGTPRDDVGYIRALLDTLGRRLSIDPRRIFATGISNGAMFSYRLACDLPGVFAAIAPVAGAMPEALVEGCAHVTPVALAAFQGTADPLVPYDGGGVVRRRGQVLSATRSVELWSDDRGLCPTAGSRAGARQGSIGRDEGAPHGLHGMQGWPRRGAVHHRRRRPHLAGRTGLGPGRGSGDTGHRRDHDDLVVLLDAPEAVTPPSFLGLTMDYPLTVDAIARRASTLWARRAVISRRTDGSLHRSTYGECLHRAGRLAAALQRLGISRGDRVATLMWNHYAHLEAYFAVPCLGRCCTRSTCGSTRTTSLTSPTHAGDRFLIVDDVAASALREISRRHEYPSST